MIIENTLNSLMNFIPEIILFIMSMIVLLAGTFRFSTKYVFHITLLSVVTALLLSFQNYSVNASLLLIVLL